MNQKYCTVVFHIKDEAAWDVEWARLWPMFLNKDTPLRVVSVCADDVMEKVSLIEEALERCTDHYLLRSTIADIIACGDVATWKWPGDE